MLVWGLSVAVAYALLIGNTIAWKGRTELSDLKWPRRHWEDVSAAIKIYLDRHFPPEANRLPTSEGQAIPSESDESRTAAWQACRDVVVEKTRNWEITPRQFWRTIPARPLLKVRDRFRAVRPGEDAGRAKALVLGFEVLDGVSPYLLVWLATLACLPVLLWVSWEMFDAGYPAAGGTLLLLWGSSLFVVDCLSLAHSGAGFYLLALLVLMGLTAYTGLSDRKSPAGFLVRGTAAGAVFGVCSVIRSDTVLLFPGFAAALALGTLGLVRQRGTEHPTVGAARMLAIRTVALGGVLALFLLPYFALNPPRPRPVWLSVWEGLGDFDTTKGHYWRDADAARVLREAGHEPGPESLFGWLDESGEAYFRDSVLQDVRSDPLWYGRILRDRLFATITQEKLWPLRANTGREIALSTYPNQGDTDKYYRLTTTVDWFGIGERRVEVPVSLLVLPTSALLLWGLVVWARRRRDAHPNVNVLRSVAALVPAALGALGAPVFISTASAIETQAFALVYFLGLGLLVNEVARLRGGRRAFARSVPARRATVNR